jgi:hypothetical protein
MRNAEVVLIALLVSAVPRKADATDRSATSMNIVQRAMMMYERGVQQKVVRGKKKRVKARYGARTGVQV